jgi:hypothetical protein
MNDIFGTSRLHAVLQLIEMVLIEGLIVDARSVGEGKKDDGAEFAKYNTHA